MEATVLAVTSLVALVALPADAQRLFSGGCPQPPVQEDFNMTQFVGKWYEVEKTGSLLQEGLRCVETEYAMDDGQLSIITKGINSLPYPANDKKIEKKEVLPLTTTYQILSTDYDNYAVVWSCVPLLGRIGHS
ncbi:APOD, partial [Cordylochernes scorpioides]